MEGGGVGQRTKKLKLSGLVQNTLTPDVFMVPVTLRESEGLRVDPRTRRGYPHPVTLRGVGGRKILGRRLFGQRGQKTSVGILV